jgi:hypothetical protein
MYVSNVGNTPIPNLDSDASNPGVRGQESADRRAEVQPGSHTSSAQVEPGLMSRSAPDGADPKLWEMLGPAERAYLSGGFDRLSYGQDPGTSGMGRGVYVDMRV